MRADQRWQTGSFVLTMAVTACGNGASRQYQQQSISSGAFHSADVPYSFDFFYTPSDPQKLRPWTRVDHDLGDTMSSYWANFTTAGDPNGTGLPAWGAYAGDIQSQEFGDTVQPSAVMGDTKASFWKTYLGDELGL